MEKSHDLQTKANLYAGSRLRALRGEASRVVFGERIGMKESLLFKYEQGQTDLTLGKLTRLARSLDVPLSYFIIPDDHPAFREAEVAAKGEETAA